LPAVLTAQQQLAELPEELRSGPVDPPVLITSGAELEAIIVEDPQVVDAYRQRLKESH
jgi:hypothetical protein